MRRDADKSQKRLPPIKDRETKEKPQGSGNSSFTIMRINKPVMLPEDALGEKRTMNMDKKDINKGSHEDSWIRCIAAKAEPPSLKDNTADVDRF